MRIPSKFHGMIITETSVFQSVDDGYKAIKHLTTLQKRPMAIYQTTKIPRQKCKFELLL
jgi:hypothetical protein